MNLCNKSKNEIKYLNFISFFDIIGQVIKEYADVAELADAPDSKSGGKPCGFESHHRYQYKVSN